MASEVMKLSGNFKRSVPRSVTLEMNEMLRQQRARALVFDPTRPKDLVEAPDTKCPWVDGWRRIAQPGR